MNLYLLILKNYYTDKIINYDKNFIQENISKIAIVLNYWENEDEIVKIWIEKIKNSRFININRLLII